MDHLDLIAQFLDHGREELDISSGVVVDPRSINHSVDAVLVLIEP